MKCPQCGYDNKDDALSCNMCRAVLRKERTLSPPASPPAPPAAAGPPRPGPTPGAHKPEPPPAKPTGEPAKLNSPAAVQALLEHVFRVGSAALKASDEAALSGEVPRLASRFFLELAPGNCRKLVLEPVARDWLRLCAPELVSPERHAKARAELDAMLEEASARRFVEAIHHLRAADAIAGKHGWYELLILGLGLKHAADKAKPAPPPPVAPPPTPPRRPPLAKGDALGQKYEIHGVLGEGGFGIVYLAYHRPSDTVMALKTFRDEFLEDEETRALFRKEAQLLVDLDPHPHLVRAYLVDEVHGRLFVALEFVAPDADGLNTLEGHLKRRPPDLARSLRWAIQFCHGMEFAQSRGLRCHRDIKPANIMIDAGGRLLISDFGLAGALQLSKLTGKPVRGDAGGDGRTAAGSAFGTPTHMPPEQFTGADKCDERSDVYAFGVVLFQMAARGRVPFWSDDRARFFEGMYRLHASAPVPALDSPLFPIIQRCLQKNPIARFQKFGELRQHLETLLHKTTGEAPPPPEVKRREDADWNAKGLSLAALGRHEDALACFDKSLSLAPTTQAWNNKGAAYMRLARWAEAISCFDGALALQDGDSPWVNKSGAFLRMGRKEEALAAAEAALQRDPTSRGGWSNKGAALLELGRREEALVALERALAIDPGSEETWATKVAVLQELGRVEQALAAADECLAIHPAFAIGWSNKGYCLSALGRHEEALACFDRAVGLDARLVSAWAGKRTAARTLGRGAEVMAALDRELELDPEHGPTWLDKGRELTEAKRWREALPCLENAVRFEPQWPLAWTNLGLCLLSLDRLPEAEAAYGKALAINPAHATAALTRGDILRRLSRFEEAVACFDVAIEAGGAEPGSAPRVGAAWFYRGECLHRLGRCPEAQASYARALGLLPEPARPGVTEAAEACRRNLPPPH